MLFLKVQSVSKLSEIITISSYKDLMIQQVKKQLSLMLKVTSKRKRINLLENRLRVG